MLWLRATVIHPVVPVAVLVVASYVLGSGGEAFVGILFLLFLLLLAAPVAAAFLTAWMLDRSSASGLAKAGFLGVTLLVGCAAAFVGIFMWGAAIEMACQGRYECPI